MPGNETKLFQVRLTEAEKRRIKTLAVSQGLTLRQATVQAFEAWAARLPSPALPGEFARGRTAASNREKRGQSRPAVAPRLGRQRAEGTPAATPGGGSQAADARAASQAWLRRAAQLDWSKCPAVESVQGESGKILVVRGTDAPLAEVLQSVADGHPVVQIADVFELTMQQLVAVLQFATEGAAPAGSVS